MSNLIYVEFLIFNFIYIINIVVKFYILYMIQYCIVHLRIFKTTELSINSSKTACETRVVKKSGIYVRRKEFSSCLRKESGEL